MPDLGSVVYLIAFSYGMGVLWYTLLGRNYTNWMRMAAFPLLGAIIGQAVWTNYLSTNAQHGLVFFGSYVYVTLISTFLGAVLDIAVSWMAKEHPVTNVLKPFEHLHHQASKG